MTLYQLHYTSCKDGLSGYSGFQFCAASPGVPQSVLREVERHTIYEPPHALQASGTRQPGDFPVNLLYAFNRSPEIVIMARVQFTGLDFSNRSGNYFAHSLITENPDADLHEVMPVELWDASFWQSRQGGQAELAPLPPPRPSGFITRPRIAAFLAADGATSEQVAALLTAAEAAMAGGRQVLLVGPDAENVCQWIAVASYLLGPGIAGRLSFSTYSYDPRRCSTHIVGTISAAGPLRADIVRGFHVFDRAEEAVPDVAPSSAALLLTRLSVVAAADLWALARSLDPASAPPLAEALPMLAAAALMLDHRLTTPELAAALGWLDADGRTVTAEQFAAAVQGAVRLRLVELSAREKHQLLSVAARGQEPGETPGGALVGLVEQELVVSAFAEFDRGQPIGAGTRLLTLAARELALDCCSMRLRTSDPQVVVDLLTWAGAVGIEPADQLVWLGGRDAILPGLLAGEVPSGLAEIAGDWPVLRAGVTAGLTGLPGSRQHKLLTSRAAGLFRPHDFAADQVLGTEWLITQARSGGMSRAAALASFVSLRGSWRYTPADLARLIEQLWDGREWTPHDGTELVGLLDAGMLAEDPVRSRLTALLRTLPEPGSVRDWEGFVVGIAGLPHGELPPEQADLADELSRLIALMARAERDSPPDEALAELLRGHAGASKQARGLLNRRLPPLLLRHSDLSSVLGNCPPDLFRSFCEFSAGSLAHDRLGVREIANLVVCMQLLKAQKLDYGADLEELVLRPELREWKPAQINTLAVEVDSIAQHLPGQSSNALKLWHRRIRRRSIRLPRLWSSSV